METKSLNLDDELTVLEVSILCGFYLNQMGGILNTNGKDAVTIRKEMDAAHTRLGRIIQALPGTKPQ